MARRHLVKGGLAVTVGVLLITVTISGYLVHRKRCHLRTRERLTPIILRACRRHQIDAALVFAVVRQESNFNPDARGSSGEVGLMQLMPGAARDWETAHRRRLANDGLLFRPAVNIEIGVWYLARAMRQFRHHPEPEVLALSQYNAGRSRALRWEADYPENLLQSIPIPSTRHYISNVMEYRALYHQEVQRIGDE